MRNLSRFVGAALAALSASLVDGHTQNQGLSLQNGVVTHIDVPYAPTLLPRGGITVEAWVTYDSSTLGPGFRYPTILRMDPAPNQASYFLRVEAGQNLTNRLLWWVGTPNGNFTVGYTFTTGALTTWTHVAATYDGANLRLFVGGIQVASAAGSGAIIDRGGVLRIGNGDTTIVGGETWNGEIDEVRVWPFARSAEAIRSTMQRQIGLLPGEVSSWSLNGDGLDSSGTNHGVGFGSPAFVNNSLVLQVQPFSGAANYGNGSGCRTNVLTAIAAPASVGNDGFGFACVRAPANASGVFLLSLANLSSPFPVLGIDLWVNVAAPGLTAAVASNMLGTSMVPLPVPNNGSLVSLPLNVQNVWADASCATGLVGSNALQAVIVP